MLTKYISLFNDKIPSISMNFVHDNNIYKYYWILSISIIDISVTDDICFINKTVKLTKYQILHSTRPNKSILLIIVWISWYNSYI